jgi:tRNA(Ile)-lysidine synthase
MSTPTAEFLASLRAGCQRLDLRSRRWLVAVSGGADSVALLRGLGWLQPEFGWELTVAHFDHRLRGAESAADAEWVRQLAAALRLPVQIGGAEDAIRGSPNEETARRRRYAFLERAAHEAGCPVIATAHTADDQAETVLHHLLRGAGLAGLRGIPRERPLANGVTVVRPMLDISREQVLGFLGSLHQDYRCDSTNVDVQLTRNWLRHQILPELRDRWPHITATLCRLSQQADDVFTAVSQLGRELCVAALVDEGPDVVRLSVTPLVDRPRHLVRQAFAELWRDQNWPLQEMSYEQWNRLADLVTAEGTAMFPGGIEARRRGALLILRRVG